MPYKTINSASLYYEETGTGSETVFFGHGLLFSLRMFDNIVDVLKDRYRCIRFDFRGQGKSEVTKNGYDIDSLTEDARALMENMDCAPCHFIGFSMGGFVGLRLATRYPELLKSLTLIDTSADEESQKTVREYTMLNFIARWIGLGVVHKKIMATIFGSEFLTDPDRKSIRQTWKDYLLANDRVGVTRAVKGVIHRSGITASHLSTIACPTLILVGEEDHATIPKHSRAMHEHIPGSKLELIPRSGHMSPIEEPDLVNKAVADFLDTVTGQV